MNICFIRTKPSKGSSKLYIKDIEGVEYEHRRLVLHLNPTSLSPALLAINPPEENIDTNAMQIIIPAIYRVVFADIDFTGYLLNGGYYPYFHVYHE